MTIPTNTAAVIITLHYTSYTNKLQRGYLNKKHQNSSRHLYLGTFYSKHLCSYKWNKLTQKKMTLRTAQLSTAWRSIHTLHRIQSCLLIHPGSMLDNAGAILEWMRNANTEFTGADTEFRKLLIISGKSRPRCAAWCIAVLPIILSGILW